MNLPEKKDRTICPRNSQGNDLCFHNLCVHMLAQKIKFQRKCSLEYQKQNDIHARRTRDTRVCSNFRTIQANVFHRECNLPGLPVASICEWCDDESATVTQVFVSIVNTGGDHAHNSFLVFKVISELRKPLEVIYTVHSILTHLGNNITS